MTTLAKRLDVQLAVAAAAAAGAVNTADAAIVWSGPVNIPIPLTTAGVYLNVVTGVNGPAPAGVPGWDINPWSATTLNWFNPAAPAGGVYVVSGGTVSNLAPNTTIGPASSYGSGASGPSFQFNSSNNIVGFRFQAEPGNTLHYGWVRVRLGATFIDPSRAIVEYAFESVPQTPIGAGVVPAPASMALLALGAAGLVSRRRK